MPTLTRADYYHDEYYSILKTVMSNGTDMNIAPYSDNNLINGKMNFDCTTLDPTDKTPCSSNAGVSKFKFTTGKTHRLRLINAGAEGLQRFSIDGHTLTVIANDFVPIVCLPYSSLCVFILTASRNLTQQTSSPSALANEQTSS